MLQTSVAVAISVMWGMLALPCGAIAQQPEKAADVVLVSKMEAKCIAANVDVFLEQEGDSVTIYLDLCSQIQFNTIIAGNIRTDIPDLDLPPVKPTPNPQSPIVAIRSVSVTKAALKCLKAAAAVAGFPSTDPYPLVSKCQ